ncbi:MAG: hypothetical protein L0Z50_20920 [Verrucomicrobiales bacterium]|nr:hypothetical protein [Verrucomicrobiales bacterium]
MSVTLSKPERKFTILSVRHIYPCKEYPTWRIEHSHIHITVGERSREPYPDLWQVWHLSLPRELNRNGNLVRWGSCWGSCWELVSEHRTKGAAIKAMTKAIRKDGGGA